MQTKEEKKKALVQWLNHPITGLYIKLLKQHSAEIKDGLFEITKNSFIGKGILKRNATEISLHTRLCAIDIVLGDFIPLFDFMDKCNKEELEILDVPEKYEEEHLGERLQHENPLDLFINKL